MDLHPLTVPNNAVIDALNATLLTYNGNEFLLQNDMGNYKLENCKLPTNFIPVGIAEYADTLYIASYNPITKETELGSYPSPRTIFATNDKDQSLSFTPLINDEDCNELSNPLIYTDVGKLAKLQMYMTDEDIENYKLNPGDKFIILQDAPQTFPYQDIQFSILTEEKKLVPLDIPRKNPDGTDAGYIVPSSTNPSGGDYKYVFWDTPGWLCGKYQLAEIDNFYLNLRSCKLPEFTAGSTFDIPLIEINSQIETLDRLFKSDSTTKHLKIMYDVELVNNPDGAEILTTADNIDPITGDIKYSFTLTDGKLHAIKKYNYNNDINIFYNNASFGVTGVNIDTIIKIIACPYIEYVVGVGTINECAKYLKYDQFKTELEIPLSSIGNTTDINAANIVWKYMMDDPSENPLVTKNLTLVFNIDGPFLLTSNVKVNLEIYPISSEAHEPILSKSLEEVNLLGTSLINIDADDLSKIEKEDIYIVSIIFKEGSSELKRVNKVMILSKYIESFYNTVDNFHNINLNEWLSLYLDDIKDTKITLNNHKSTQKNKELTWKTYPSSAQWLNGTTINTSSYVVNYKSDVTWYHETSSPPSAPIYYYLYDYESLLTFKSDFKSSTKKLWNDISWNDLFTYNILNYDGTKLKQEHTNILMSDTFDKSISINLGGKVMSEYVKHSDVKSLIKKYTKIELFPNNSIPVISIMGRRNNCSNDGGGKPWVEVNSGSLSINENSDGKSTLGTRTSLSYEHNYQNASITANNSVQNRVKKEIGNGYALMVFSTKAGCESKIRVGIPKGSYQYPGGIVFFAMTGTNGYPTCIPFFKPGGSDFGVTSASSIDDVNSVSFSLDVMKAIRDLKQNMIDVVNFSEKQVWFFEPIANKEIIDTFYITDIALTGNIKSIFYTIGEEKYDILSSTLLLPRIEDICKKIGDISGLIGFSNFTKAASFDLNFNNNFENITVTLDNNDDKFDTTELDDKGLSKLINVINHDIPADVSSQETNSSSDPITGNGPYLPSNLTNNLAYSNLWKAISKNSSGYRLNSGFYLDWVGLRSEISGYGKGYIQMSYVAPNAPDSDPYSSTFIPIN